MNTRIILAVATAAMLGGCTGEAPISEDSEALDTLHGKPEPQAAEPHLHYARGAKPGGGGSALMTYHGGSLLLTNKAMAIFWGSEWSSASFQGDKLTGVDSFFNGLDGSNFAATSDEYTDGSGAHVTSTTGYLGHTIDTTAAPRKAITTSQAVTEACKIAGNNPDPNAIYFLYTSTGAGHVNYCAWHSYGTCSNGAPIQVAYMPNVDGIAGCDPQDTWTNHSQGLAAVINVTSHEWSEARTDPRNGGYYDGSGEENGDKCAWAFNAPVTLKNGSTWKLQMEWSNAAYSANNGLPNLSGQNGCLQGN
jgi:hypothetical protein